MASSSSDFDITIDKLESAKGWPRWKWQMNITFRVHGFDKIINGEETCPELSKTPSAAQKRELSEWQKRDAQAALLMVRALSGPIIQFVMTCTHAKDIWEKLISMFEGSDSIRLNTLIQSFFRAERNPKEDVTTHISKLEELFSDLNDCLKIHGEKTLSEKILIGKILSTLDEDFNKFKDEWGTIPLKDQTLDLLMRKLCPVETRSPVPQFRFTAECKPDLIFKKKSNKPEIVCPVSPKPCLDFNFIKGNGTDDCPKIITPENKILEKESREKSVVCVMAHAPERKYPIK